MDMVALGTARAVSNGLGLVQDTSQSTLHFRKNPAMIRSVKVVVISDDTHCQFDFISQWNIAIHRCLSKSSTSLPPGVQSTSVGLSGFGLCFLHVAALSLGGTMLWGTKVGNVHTLMVASVLHHKRVSMGRYPVNLQCIKMSPNTLMYR